jgi:acyl transferase domain-containing protein/NADP-dependent 3-hydroxy acid dehydrogenase YdfG/acyl carrier protein
MHVPSRVPIAVVGVSALFPGSSDALGFWRDILAGRDLLSDVPPSHWLLADYYDPDPAAPDKTYGRRGSFLSPVEFDPLEHGIPPNIVPATDTSQLLGLILAKQVLEDASQGQFSKVDRERVSVILGSASAQELVATMASRLQRPVWVKALREHGLPEAEVQSVCDRIAASYVPWQESTFPGLLGNVIAGRIANRMDLGGTNCVTDAACASSLAAVSMALSELWTGDSDLVIAGGVETLNDILMFVCFSKTPALSPTQDCRPFSAAADGTMLGEGLGMLALRRLEDAERDGDRIYAVIRGLGASSDGKAKSVYAPVPAGQARALRRAYAAAGYGPESVELLEAHGTATRAGDAAEFEGLRSVFDASGRADRQWCALGSVKSQVGHTKASAGVAGLFKAIMAVHHKILPPTIKVAEPNPALRIAESPFHLNTETRPWIRAGDHPRRASVSSFGFGGSNFHVALEEYVGPAPRARRLRTSPTELVVLSAESPEALVARCRALTDGDLASFAATARSSQADFDRALPARLALVARDSEDLREALRRAADSVGRDPLRAFSSPQGVHYAHGTEAGGIAFLFPGQGSQYLGMGGDLAMAFDVARRPWDEAAGIAFDPTTPLHDVVFPRPAFTEDERRRHADRLTATEWAQPALAAASAGYLALLGELGVVPAAVAGHSFGEVTALYAAGVIGFPDLLRTARRRGELMAAASAVPGRMLAIAHPVDALRGLIENGNGEVVVANHNSPRQAVVSGPATAVDAFEVRLREQGITSRPIPVSTAFHSPLVAGSSGPFLDFLRSASFAGPRVPVYSNAEAAPYPDEPESIRARLAEQIARPVRFVEMVEALYREGCRTFVEVGPGSVLTPLVGECLEGRAHTAVSLDRKGQPGLTSLWSALGRLAVAGVGIDWAPLWSAYEPLPAPPAGKKPGLTLSISGTNYGKPYPPAEGAAALPPPNPPRPQPVLVAAPSAVASAAPPPAAIAAPLPPAAPPSAAPPAWVVAYLDVQRQTAEAHAAYQKAMADTHVAYLRTAEASLANLTALATGQPAPRLDLPPPPVQPPFVAPPEPPMPMPAPLPAAPPPPPAAAPSPSPVAASAVDIERVVLSVVSEMTGYPAEMLALDMEIESGLGIDSIKRVEILSALEERLPHLPDLPTAEMSTLRTLGQLVSRLRNALSGNGGGMAGVVASERENEPAAPSPSPVAATAVDIERVVLSVVSEMTGYPAEMLALDMEIESGLGIDSIKRVEILSALEERLPHLPDLPTAEMSTLRTLGQLVSRLRSALSGNGGGTARVVESERKSEPAAAARAPLARLATGEVAAPATGFALPGLFAEGPLFVTDDGGGVAAAVIEQLLTLGIEARLAGPVPAEAGKLLFLGGLRELPDADAAIAVNREAFVAARTIAQRLAAGVGLFVTVQDTGGDFGLGGGDPTRAWTGGLAGLAKTAAGEWPLASVKAIDLERGGRSPEALAGVLVAELLRGGSEREVGLHADGSRTTLVARGAAAPEGADVLHAGSVIVATGGGRGVTGAALVELARRFRCRIALLGRTPLVEEPEEVLGLVQEEALNRALLARATAAGRALDPAALRAESRGIIAGREIRATLLASREAGALAEYWTVDVRNGSAVAACLDEVRARFGPITALVHGAGVLADKRIAEKTDEQFDRVFDTKILGLRALLAATAGEPLEAIVLFSSVAGRYGNPGQCDYAMANEVLNKVAAAEKHRRGGRCVVRSLNWGPWDGGMVGPSLRAHFEEQGVALIPLEAGARMMLDELRVAEPAPVEIVIAGAGDPGAGGRTAPPEDLHVLVSARTHPYLGSHRVQDVPVVPVVLALEWFARAAQVHYPALVFAACRELKVRKGIRLSSFDGAGERFVVKCRPESSDGRSLALELRGVDGALHYTATVEMAALGDRPATPLMRSNGSLETWALPGVLYGDLLFHGPDFQVIRGIDGVGPDGAGALLAGLRDIGWNGGPWATDAAVLDGGLQLARLFGLRMLGQPSLPTSIGAFIAHRAGPVEGEVRCLLHARSVTHHRTVSDLLFTGSDGQPLAEMREVEMHVLPVAEPAVAPPG